MSVGPFSHDKSLVRRLLDGTADQAVGNRQVDHGAADVPIPQPPLNDLDRNAGPIRFSPAAFAFLVANRGVLGQRSQRMLCCVT